MEKLILVDGNSLIFRAYYATAYTNNFMKTSDGKNTNALFGFLSMFIKLLNTHNPDHILVAFDTGKPTFRHELRDDYKGTRVSLPEELKEQFQYVRDALTALNIKQYEVDGYEADDIIGTCSKWANPELNVHIVTSDKDMLQLISDNCHVLITKKGITNIEVMDRDALKAFWSIEPHQVSDLKGLMGDPSDNIKGVAGVGEKTAIKLINEYGSVEGIYENIDSIKGKLKEKLETDKDSAFESKMMATIITDLELPFGFEDLKVDIDYHKFNEFCMSFEMNSLIQVVDQKPNDFKYELVKKVNSSLLVDGSSVVFESYFTNNYHKALILGAGISNKINDEIVSEFIEYSDMIKDHEFLSYLESTKTKITYNLKELLVISHWHQIKINGVKDDLMLAHYCLDCINKSTFDCFVMDYQADLPLHEAIYQKGAKKAIPEVEKYAHYAAFKSKLLFEKRDLIIEKLKINNQIELYEMELECSLVLSKMEINGIHVDKTVLNDFKAILETKILDEEIKIYQFAGEKFNISSVKQLGEILFDRLNLRVVKKTKTGYSTDNEVLTELINDHPIIESIINYRQYKKLLSTYVDGFYPWIFEDNKVHTIYYQADTTTGRLSSQDPNLQNIPTKTELGKEIKKFFKASDNKVLLSFDYSQIELRIFAAYAKASELIKGFEQDLDIHSITAKKVFNLDEVTNSYRSLAKAVNFGIIYGISDFGLASQLNISRKEAGKLIEDYFISYPEIKNYMDFLIEDTSKKGYALTMMNRKRTLNELNDSNFRIRELGKRLALNTPIQGTGADIIKKAMVDCQKWIDENDYDLKLLLQVHDELIFECDKSQVEAVIPNLKKIMENTLDIGVKLKVDYGFGKSWFEIK